jgi:hypothetical protein
MKHLVMQLSPPSCHSIPLWSKYSPLIYKLCQISDKAEGSECYVLQGTHRMSAFTLGSSHRSLYVKNVNSFWSFTNIHLLRLLISGMTPCSVVNRYQRFRKTAD